MNEFDLYVPMVIKGRKLSARALSGLKKRLLKKFGGLTYFPQKLDGFWKIGGATFQDDIVILRVISEKPQTAFWNKLKYDLQRQWHQKEILIVARAIKVLR